MRTAPVDAIDKRILQLLRQDGRMSNARLAEAVGLSPSACLRRLHILENNGTIRGYTAIIADPEPEDVTMVIIQISLDRQTEERAAARRGGKECVSTGRSRWAPDH